MKDRLLHGSESLSQLSPDGTGGLQLGLGELHMALGKGAQQRLLVREVLVQRADANAGRFGDAVGGGGETLALENPSRGLQHEVHRRPRARLHLSSSSSLQRLARQGHDHLPRPECKKSRTHGRLTDTPGHALRRSLGLLA